MTRLNEDRWSTTAAAAAFGVSVQIVRKWRRGFRADGNVGLRDRTSNPTARDGSSVATSGGRSRSYRRSDGAIHRSPIFRRLPVSTVDDVLRRLRLGRLRSSGRVAARRRGETGAHGRGVIHRITGARRQPSASRGGGSECLHIAIDDASRVAYAELLPDESGASAVVVLYHAVHWLATLGVHVEAVITDNAFWYVRRQDAEAMATLGLRHLRRDPFNTRTIGKVERSFRPRSANDVCKTLPLLPSARWRPCSVSHILQHDATACRRPSISRRFG
jgi:hypothetical protein